MSISLRTSQELEDLFQLDLCSLRVNRLTKWSKLLNVSQTPILIFGAGELGVKTLNGLLNAGIRPTAIIDNSAGDLPSFISGVPVHTPDSAAEIYGRQCVCLISVYNTSKPREQLKSLGFQTVVHCIDAFAALPDYFLPFVCLEDSDVISNHQDEIRQALCLMADDESRECFLSQLRYRLFLDFDFVKIPQTPSMRESEYFPNNIYLYQQDEVFVDCGAFNGDTLERFIDARGGSFAYIYAFEPDEANYTKLCNFVSACTPRFDGKTKLIMSGVGKSNEVLSYNNEGAVTSRASIHGNTLIHVSRLDDICNNPLPTLIKMDIEGAEMDALKGAKNIISNHSPVLAICIYHLCSHLWEIPLLISKFNPSYQIYLRAHAEDCWDVACYAVPPHRLPV